MWFPLHIWDSSCISLNYWKKDSLNRNSVGQRRVSCLMLSPHTDFCRHTKQLFQIIFSFLLWKAVNFHLEEALLTWKLIENCHPVTKRVMLVARSLLKLLSVGFQHWNAHHWKYLQCEWHTDSLHISSTCTRVSSQRQPEAPLEGHWRQSSDPCWWPQNRMLLYVPIICFTAIRGRGSCKPSTPSRTSFEISVCMCAHMHMHLHLSKENWRHLNVIPQFNSQVLRGWQALQVWCAARSRFQFTLQRHKRSSGGDVNSLIKQKSMPSAH